MCFRLKKASFRFPTIVGFGPSMPSRLKYRNLLRCLKMANSTASSTRAAVMKSEDVISSRCQWNNWSERDERPAKKLSRNYYSQSCVVNIRYQFLCVNISCRGDIKINCVPELSQFALVATDVREMDDNEGRARAHETLMNIKMLAPSSPIHMVEENI